MGRGRMTECLDGLIVQHQILDWTGNESNLVFRIGTLFLGWRWMHWRNLEGIVVVIEKCWLWVGFGHLALLALYTLGWPFDALAYEKGDDMVLFLGMIRIGHPSRRRL